MFGLVKNKFYQINYQYFVCFDNLLYLSISKGKNSDAKRYLKSLY